MSLKEIRSSADVSNEEIAIALLEARGNMSKAADHLCMSHTSLWRRVKNNPALTKIHGETEERTLDYVESKLMEKIEKGDIRAIFFYLKCKGKKRGWVERKVHEGNPDKPLRIVLSPASDVNAPTKTVTAEAPKKIDTSDAEDAQVEDKDKNKKPKERKRKRRRR